MRVLERAVQSVNGSDVCVRQNGDAMKLTWICGEARDFTAEDLQLAVEHVNALADYPDVWMQLHDSDGTMFAVQLRDGILCVAESPRDHPDGVSWKELRKAISKGLEDNTKHTPESTLTGY